MTDKPSIESLRDILRYTEEHTLMATIDLSMMDRALSELESLRAEREALKQWYDQHEEHEAACCPEDVGCIEFIGYLKDSLTAERARADAMAASNEAIRKAAIKFMQASNAILDHARSHGWDGMVPDEMEWIKGVPEALGAALSSTPAADLEAHDARVKREALEGAWERIESEPEFPGEMPTEVWRQTRDATKEQFEAAMRGLLRAWKAKAKAAILGPNAQPNELEGK